MKEQDPKLTVHPISKWAKNDPAWKGLPNLLEAIAATHFDDGKPRFVWTLGVTYENGQITVKINDKPKRRSAQIIAQTLQEAFQELDDGIKNGSLTWRPWGEEKRR